jgi:hypothetical protein
MSKKILIDSDLLKDLLEGDFLPVKVWHERRKEGRKLLEESKEKRFSVFEWHPVSERIGKGYDILIRFNNGNVAPALSDDFDYAIERGAIEWAYLPE